MIEANHRSLSKEEISINKTSMSEPRDIVGEYYAQARLYPQLTAEEEISLAKRIEAANSAGDEVVEKDLVRTFANHNLRLPIKIAKKYIGAGLSLEDLIQEGEIGLINGIKHYDYREGVRFSTFAYSWVKYAINDAVDDQKDAIRLSRHMKDKIDKHNEALDSFTSEHGKQPTRMELAEVSGISQSNIDLINIVSYRTRSLNNEFDDSGTEFLELIPGNLSVEEEVENRDIHDQVRDLLENLDDRETEIIDLIYGLSSGTPLTQAEIGEQLGISRPYVGKIFRQSLQKLRGIENIADLYELI